MGTSELKNNGLYVHMTKFTYICLYIYDNLHFNAVLYTFVIIVYSVFKLQHTSKIATVEAEFHLLVGLITLKQEVQRP